MKGLYNFTIKNLKQNKKRTIVTFIGIGLSCSLLFGVGLFASTYHNNMVIDTIKYSGSHHIKYKNIDKTKIDIIKNNNDVLEVITEINELTGTINDDKYHTTINVTSLDVKYHDIVDLIQGEMPKNTKEVIISATLSRAQGIKLNDKILINSESGDVEYKVIGIYKTSDQNNYNTIYSFENCYTYFSLKDDSITNIFVTLKKTKGSLKKLELLTNQIGFKFPDLEIINSNENVVVNDSLLSLYGEIGNAGVYAVIYLSTLLIVAVLSIVCILIIYNSFAISVTERKKQLGILSSVGATPMQILKSVFLEASIISAFAIPISFIFSVLNVIVILEIFNKILQDIITEPLVFAMHPTLILMSLIFIIISIFLSALFPAVRASEVTPIEAIRLSKDIKIKGKKIKTNKLVTKLFGIEGDIAFKNIKRHKKRYRTTIISLVISIILFITMSTYLNAALRAADNIYDHYSYDVAVSVPTNENQTQVLNKIKSIDEIKNIIEYKSQYLTIKKHEKELFSEEYLNLKNKGPNTSIMVISLSDDTYQKYTKKMKLNNEQPILINNINYSLVDDITNETETYNIPWYKKNADITIDFCHYDDIINDETPSNCYYQLNNLYFTNTKITGSSNFILTVIVNERIYNEIIDKKIIYEDSTWSDKDIVLELNVKNAKKFDEQLTQIFNEYPDVQVNYQNLKLDGHENRMMELAIKFALYSFITFITLIGVTSVINTINTSINLRKIEFAMLRSVGQTPASFNKMIRLESIFLGLKSLFYGLLISFGIIYLITEIASLSYGENKIKIPIPYKHIIICTVVVFIIIFLIMKYATNKLKNNNIVETIRKENI
ncbi:MAG TPA: FtsX-like permease family protein [Mollicutes bacterium]|nr:FtsX-like permease family protein [Mollicutes bacterium]